MKKFTLSRVPRESLRVVDYSCEVSFMGTNSFIWFPHEWFLEAIKSLKGIYFCLEVWWPQSSHEPPRCKLSARDSSTPTAFSPTGGLCACGVSAFTLPLCLFLVKVAFTSARNRMTAYNARSWGITPTPRSGRTQHLQGPGRWTQALTKLTRFFFRLQKRNQLTPHPGYMYLHHLAEGEKKGASGP